MLDDFVEHALAVVGRHWAHQIEALGVDAAREKVRRAVLEGYGFGFTRRRDAMRFVNLVFALGDDMVGAHPWVRRLVENRQLPPDVRIELLSEHAEDYLAGYEVE